MKDSYYIIFDRQSVVKMLKTDKFTLERGQHAVRIEFEVDDAVFKPFIIPSTRIFVPADAVQRSIEVTSSGERPDSTDPLS